MLNEQNWGILWWMGEAKAPKEPKAKAEVIEFYVPDRFRQRVKWIPQRQRGKVIKFCPPKVKSA